MKIKEIYMYRALLLTFIFILPYFTLCANFKAKESVTNLILEHKKTNHSFVNLIKNYSEKDFLNYNEWIKFLRLLTKEELINSNSDYPEFCYNIAKSLSVDQKYQDAYFFLFITLNEEKDVFTSTKKYLADFHQILGQTYYFFQRLDLSEKHLRTALKHPNISNKEKIKVLNTLSLIYRKGKDQYKSELFLRKAYDLAIEIKDTVWLGILSGNLGYLALQKNDFKKAHDLIHIDYNISSKNNEKFSQLHSLSLLIQLDVQLGEIKEAEKKFKLFDSLIKNVDNNELLELYYKAKTNYFEKIGEHELALTNFKKLLHYKDLVDSERQFLNIENAQFQIEFEKKQGENIAIKEKKKKGDLIIVGLFVICLIIGVTSYIIIKQIQHKRFQDRELLELRAQKVEQELVQTEREMRSLLSSMFDKNKVISELQEQVDNFEQNNNTKSNSEKEEILNRLQSFSIFSENDWITFKPLFEKLNPGFFEYFQQHFPDITSAEIRLAALLKLNLTKLEIARTLAISPDSVRKTNLRLRKRLKIETLEELDKFIKNNSFKP